MAHLYHSTCYWSKWRRLFRWLAGRKVGMPRLRYVTGPDMPGVVPRVESDRIVFMQTFRCDNCGDEVSIDTDWEDQDGGFIGRTVEHNPFRKRADAL